MALRIRYVYAPGSLLGYSVERLADGLYYDFADGTFKVSPTTPINALTAQAGNFAGLYRDTIASTPSAQFANGEYAVNIHNVGAANAVLGVVGATIFGGDDATVFPGGPVASVVAPVTVGTNNDKAGYALGPAGLDAITVEVGVNARQSLSPILASAAGTLSGAGTGTIVIRGGNVATTRITATTDNAGNRSTVTLTLPA